MRETQKTATGRNCPAGANAEPVESPGTRKLLLEQQLRKSKSRLARSIPTSRQRGSNSYIGVAKIMRCAHVAGRLRAAPIPELHPLRDGCMMGFAFRTEILIDADKAFYS